MECTVEGKFLMDGNVLVYCISTEFGINLFLQLNLAV